MADVHLISKSTFIANIYEIYEAFEILSDPSEREKYNRTLYGPLYEIYGTLKYPDARKRYDYSLQFINPDEI